MYVCMYIYICVCIYLYMYVCMYVYIYLLHNIDFGSGIKPIQ